MSGELPSGPSSRDIAATSATSAVAVPTSCLMASVREPVPRKPDEDEHPETRRDEHGSRVLRVIRPAMIPEKAQEQSQAVDHVAPEA